MHFSRFSFINLSKEDKIVNVDDAIDTFGSCDNLLKI